MQIMARFVSQNSKKLVPTGLFIRKDKDPVWALCQEEAPRPARFGGWAAKGHGDFRLGRTLQTGAHIRKDLLCLFFEFFNILRKRGIFHVKFKVRCFGYFFPLQRIIIPTSRAATP